MRKYTNYNSKTTNSTHTLEQLQKLQIIQQLHNLQNRTQTQFANCKQKKLQKKCPHPSPTRLQTRHQLQQFPLKAATTDNTNTTTTNKQNNAYKHYKPFNHVKTKTSIITHAEITNKTTTNTETTIQHIQALHTEKNNQLQSTRIIQHSAAKHNTQHITCRSHARLQQLQNI